MEATPLLGLRPSKLHFRTLCRLTRSFPILRIPILCLNLQCSCRPMRLIPQQRTTRGYLLKRNLSLSSIIIALSIRLANCLKRQLFIALFLMPQRLPQISSSGSHRRSFSVSLVQIDTAIYIGLGKTRKEVARMPYVTDMYGFAHSTQSTHQYPGTGRSRKMNTYCSDDCNDSPDDETDSGVDHIVFDHPLPTAQPPLSGDILHCRKWPLVRCVARIFEFNGFRACDTHALMDSLGLRWLGVVHGCGHFEDSAMEMELRPDVFILSS